MDDFNAEIQKILATCLVPNTEVCNIWMQANAPNHNAKDKTPVPFFQTIKSDINWGGVSTTAFKIICAEKDGLHLKYLMSHAWEANETLCGTFVLAKAWLLMSPDCYRKLLRNNNQYAN
eukprot:3766985-Ditylum_brightwellii.AAC.1